ncbi:hypothetical protein KP509_1Z025100 [Ceratopteris richardii]|nr:hypothetical protein KP509_1Z025100 [Ceratopteris richardii]
MGDVDGGFTFDFEGGVDAVGNVNAVPSHVSTSGAQIISTVAAAGVGSNGLVAPLAISVVGRKNYRQTVCRHWLRGLCMKGDACGFLHQLERSRMPICRFFSKYGECHEPDCIYKHTFEDVKECNMYKMGFCPNGPDCRYKHVKLPGPFPPLEESLQKIHRRLSTSNRRSSTRNMAQRQSFINYEETTQTTSLSEPATRKDVQASQLLP